jgi:hypothetical protein
MAKVDASILQAALVGYRHQLMEVTRKMDEIRRRLGGNGSVAAAAAPLTVAGEPRKRYLSPEALKRISAAQEKRWAAFRAAKGHK